MTQDHGFQAVPAPAARHGGPGCPDCGRGLDHCHETLITHVDGRLECPDPECPADALAHAWFSPCAEAHGGEGCPRCDGDGPEATGAEPALAA